VLIQVLQELSGNRGRKMRELTIKLPDKSYPILIKKGLFERAGEFIQKLFADCKVFIVTDSNVASVYGDKLVKQLDKAGVVSYLYVFPAGESSKCHNELLKIYEALGKAGITRKDTVVALGGGVTGDLTGFAASTWLRGTGFLQIPTTLLAMIDSSIGGKVAVDLPAGKNLVGSFYHPKAVLIDPLLLNTLPDRVFADGMAEVVKHGCIRDEGLFSELEQMKSRSQIMSLIDNIIQVMGSSRNIFISNETCNRQEDIMGKPYINNAVIGNGSILGCISETGELIRLYWPELDCPQQVKKMLTGFFDTRYPNSTIWFSEGDHEVEQCYLTNTNILETVAHFTKLPLKVTQTDFCLPDQPVMIRHYTIKNTGNEDFNLGIGVASHVISSPHDMGNTMFDFSLDALIHYRHSGYWAISSSHLVKEFQIGNNPFGAVWEGKLNGVDSIGMSPDGALLWDMGILQSQHEKSITMYITFSKNLADLKSLTARIKTSDYTFLREMTQNYWQAFLDRCNRVNSGNEKADRIYIRSLLLFQLMTDKNTGGILASPEIDEGFTQCGRYGLNYIIFFV
jgi:hypothetical protein